MPIYGQPEKWAAYLDWRQGDNEDGYKGDCGLVAVENALIQMGKIKITGEYKTYEGKKTDVRESIVVNFAEENNLCLTSKHTKNPDKQGGTTFGAMDALLEKMGVPAEQIWNATPEKIGELLKDGKAVIAVFNYSKVYGTPRTNGMHAALITGALYDDSGLLEGFYVCDSGLGTVLGKQASKFFLKRHQLQRGMTGEIVHTKGSKLIGI